MSHPDDERLADAALDLDGLATAGAPRRLRDECVRTVAELRRTAVLVSGSRSALRRARRWESRRLVGAGSRDGRRRGGRRPDRGGADPSERSVRSAECGPGRPEWPLRGLVLGLLAGRAVWGRGGATGAGRPGRARHTRHAAAPRRSHRDPHRLRSSSTVATTSALDAGDGYLEVWLINRDGKRMVSIGVSTPRRASSPSARTCSTRATSSWTSLASPSTTSPSTPATASSGAPFRRRAPRHRLQALGGPRRLA